MTEQYPSYSGPDESLGAPAPAGSAPRSTALAVRLMYLQVALSVVGLIVTLVSRDSLRSSISSRNTTLSQSGLDTAVTAGIIVAVVVNLAFIVLYLLLSRQVARGRNWARIVTVVLAAFSLLGGLTALAQSGVAVSRVLSVLSALIAVGLIVLLMFRPDSKAFFATRR